MPIYISDFEGPGLFDDPFIPSVGVEADAAGMSWMAIDGRTDHMLPAGFAFVWTEAEVNPHGKGLFLGMNGGTPIENDPRFRRIDHLFQRYGVAAIPGSTVGELVSYYRRRHGYPGDKFS